jgi:YVTN family beta-propeller protein
MIFAPSAALRRIAAALTAASLLIVPAAAAQHADAQSSCAPAAPPPILHGTTAPDSHDHLLVVNNRPAPETTATVDVIDPETGAVRARVPVAPQPHHIHLVPGRGVAYVTHLGGCGLEVLDLETGRVTGRIPTGAGPRHLTFSRDGASAFVADHEGGTLTVIDTARDSVLATVATGRQPNYAATTGDGSRTFVVNSGSDDVTVIGPGPAFAVLATIRVGRNPFDLAVAPDDRLVAVTNADDDTLSLVDVARLRVVGTIPLRRPGQGDAVAAGSPLVQRLNVRFSPDGRFAWVGDQLGARWAIIDLTRRQPASTCRAAAGADIVFAIPRGPMRGLALGTARYGDAVSVLDPDDGRCLGSVRTVTGPAWPRSRFDDGPDSAPGTGPHAVVFDQNGTRAFVSDRPGNTVSVLRLTRSGARLERTIPAHGYPDGIAYVHTPGGRAARAGR